MKTHSIITFYFLKVIFLWRGVVLYAITFLKAMNCLRTMFARYVALALNSLKRLKINFTIFSRTLYISQIKYSFFNHFFYLIIKMIDILTVFYNNHKNN